MEDAGMQALLHSSWNGGGVVVEQITAGLEELERVVGDKIDLVSLQELLRAEPGWQLLECGSRHVLSHRDAEEWRGVGIGFKQSSWTVMCKKRNTKNIFLRLKRRSDGLQSWCGSLYLSQGTTRQVHAEETHGFWDEAPATRLPVLVGGDMNTSFKWAEHEAGMPSPRVSTCQGERVCSSTTRQRPMEHTDKQTGRVKGIRQSSTRTALSMPGVTMRL